MDNDEAIYAIVCQCTGADSVESCQTIQSLWSNYGRILRIHLRGVQKGDPTSVIVKHICPEANGAEGPHSFHPRGWNTDASHARKLHSYNVESAWYSEGASRCAEKCRIPKCLKASVRRNETILVLEDMDACGFPYRFNKLNDRGLSSCIRWLANFHATFLVRTNNKDARRLIGDAADGLWETGTYWHLQTRRDEFEKMADGPLKESAERIDQVLRECDYQTLVHGDAKVANFCFDKSQSNVAAVDFQYVGVGCGMKDLAYFLGSCLSEQECELQYSDWLDVYFAQLCSQVDTSSIDTTDLEANWRAMFPVAWADFDRFLLGWCPSHPKLTPFSNRLVEQTLRSLPHL